MPELLRYWPELKPSRIKKNALRFWRIYVNPPRERNIYLSPEKLKQVSQKVDSINTEKQPKQVLFDAKTNQAFVTCLEGRTLQVFRINKSKLSLIDQVKFEDQCVEVIIAKGKVFITTTNFERPPHKSRNNLWILDLNTHEIISHVETGGEWSKEMATNSQNNEILISNWHSNNISVIDLTDPAKPKLKQLLKWGEAPRGIVYLPKGNGAIISGFYSGNLGIIGRNKDGVLENTFTSEPFDKSTYQGNFRHVLITADGDQAIISNLGRNLVHFWNINKRSFEASIAVGKSPNTLSFIGNDLLAVSCRDSNVVYLIDQKSKSVLGRSEYTGVEPTGLCEANNGFMVTCFKSNTLELHQIKNL